MIINDIEFLEHFGVKGQKWGIRKSEPKVEKTSFEKNKDAFKTGLKIGAVAYTGYKLTNKILEVTGNKKVTVALPLFGYADKNGIWTYGEFANIKQIKYKDLKKASNDPFSFV